MADDAVVVTATNLLAAHIHENMDVDGRNHIDFLSSSFFEIDLCWGVGRWVKFKQYDQIVVEFHKKERKFSGKNKGKGKS